MRKHKGLAILGVLLCLCMCLTPVLGAYADDTVYITKSGKKYHTTTNCRGLNNASEIYTVTKSEAESRGLEPCSLCAGYSPTPTPDPTPTPTPTPTIPTEDTVNPNPNQLNMFRMYNPNTGEHFYTSSAEEGNILLAMGWVMKE